MPTTAPLLLPGPLRLAAPGLRVGFGQQLAKLTKSGVVPERRAASGGRSYWGVSHELLIADFHAQAAAGKPFWIDPAEGTKALQIIEQVYALSR